MSKKPIIGGIILVTIIGVVFVGAQINPDNPENKEVVFHITLADPASYDKDGLYMDSFIAEEGWYEFRFVGNGDSPKTLSIELWHKIKFPQAGEGGIFSEDFDLQGTLVETETSSWYIWDYLGEKRFYFDPSDETTPSAIEIVISPNGNYDGAVSIDLIKLD